MLVVTLSRLMIDTVSTKQVIKITSEIQLVRIPPSRVLKDSSPLYVKLNLVE